MVNEGLLVAEFHLGAGGHLPPLESFCAPLGIWNSKKTLIKVTLITDSMLMQFNSIHLYTAILH